MPLNYTFAADDAKDFVDSDGDGIADPFDVCPNQPETYNGFADNDGCPDSTPSLTGALSDQDGDGIPDAIDACPNEPERYNGFQDDDGCPDIPPYTSDIDSDLDGIPNSIDQCP